MTNNSTQITLQTTNDVLDFIVFLGTGLYLNEIAEDMKQQVIQDSYDMFMAYVDDYFEENNLKREKIRLNYSKQTGQPVLSTMPGFSKKVGEALQSYIQFRGYQPTSN